LLNKDKKYILFNKMYFFLGEKKELKILYRISINVIDVTFKYVIIVNDLYRREK